MSEPYPLHWPQGWPRTPSRNRAASRFKTTLGRSRDDLYRELERFGAHRVVVSTDIPTRLDGLFYANAREPDDPGVACYFTWRGRPFVVACDTYDYVRENVRAIHKTVEALRTVERHGATQLLERATQGFSALPPGSEAEGQEARRPWWEVIEVPVDAETCAKACNEPTHPLRPHLLKIAEVTYKVMIRDAHPDRGGDVEQARDLNVAIGEARALLSEGGEKS